jgi:hypothetical protein
MPMPIPLMIAPQTINPIPVPFNLWNEAIFVSNSLQEYSKDVSDWVTAACLSSMISIFAVSPAKHTREFNNRAKAPK